MTDSLLDLEKRWQDLGSTNPTTNTEALRNVQPKPLISGSGFVDAPPKQGIIKTVLEGMPEGYSPTFGESFAFQSTQFIRNLVNSGVQLFQPELYERNKALQEAGKTDAKFNQLFGKQDDTKAEAAKKFTGAAIETALTVIPVGWLEKVPALAVKGFQAGRAIKAADTALDVARAGSRVPAFLQNAGSFIKDFKSVVATGGAYGGAQGFSTGLQKDGGSWEDVLKSTAVGAGFGSAVGLGIPLALKGAGAAVRLGVNATNKGIALAEAGATKGKQLAQKILPPGWIEKKVPISWYKNIFSGDSTLNEYFGDIGRGFVSRYNEASAAANNEMKEFVAGMIEKGLVKPPVIAGRAFKNVAYVGDDVAKMSFYNKVLRGLGEFKDRAVQQAAINSDETLQYLDYTRKWYAARALDTGGTAELLDINTYLPKYTPVVELKPQARAALAKAVDKFEREAVYASNNPIVAEMIEDSINRGSFRTAEEAYKTYYDYVDLVQGGSRIDLNKNKFLQHMVETGQAATIDEARGKIIRDLKFRESTLTPRASSLDFTRDVSLPWYDPNPARVMPAYALDASSRMALAQQFGKNDEVIREMIGKISSDANVSPAKAVDNAKDFEQLVRHIMGQMPKNRDAEKWSAWFRGLQTVKLAFAQTLNLGQSLNFILPTDLEALGYGLSQVFKQDGLRSAVKRGVLMNSMMNDLLSYSGGGSKFAEHVLNYSGFTASEMINRAVGSGVAESFYGRVFKTLLKERGIKISPEQEQVVRKMMADREEFNKRLGQRIGDIQNTSNEVGKVIEFAPDIRELALEQVKGEFPTGQAYDDFIATGKKALADAGAAAGRTVAKGVSKGKSYAELILNEAGIDVDEALARGFLTEDDFGIAAQKLVGATQFLNRNIDLPVFAASPLGKVLFQFKNFAYMQARFLKRQFMTDLERGDYAKAMRNIVILGTVFPMTGEVLADVRSLVTGEKRPTPILDRYISNMANAGAYGLFYDFFNQAVRGDVVDFVAGPTLGDAGKWLQGITNVASGNFESGGSQLLRQGLKQTGVGRPISNIIFPSTMPGRTFAEDLREWSGD